MAEIYLLLHFDLYLQDGTILDFVIGGPRRRMPRQTEALLVHSFDVYKEKHTRTQSRQAGASKAGASTASGAKAK